MKQATTILPIIEPGDTRATRIAAIGMFDGVHRGHLHLLHTLATIARREGMEPVVVTFANHPRQLLHPGDAPGLLTAPDERRRRLTATEATGVVMLTFDDTLRRMSAADFLTMLRDLYNIKAVLLGFNNHFGHDHPATREDYDRLGEETGVHIFHAGEYRNSISGKVSSSVIRRLLAEGDIAAANLLLGYRYRIVGRVVHGKELGRTIGFPTANIEPLDPHCMVPADGVYAVSAILPDGSTFPAMVNIGHRPTVDNPATALRSIEAHIIGFNGDIYGSVVSIAFVRFLRKERKFATLDELRAQLTIDAHATKESLQQE